MNSGVKERFLKRNAGGHFEFGDDYARGYDKAGKMIYSSHKSGAGTWVHDGDADFMCEEKPDARHEK